MVSGKIFKLRKYLSYEKIGRKLGVGWGIREIRLSKDLETISATEIRKKNKEKELWK